MNFYIGFDISFVAFYIQLLNKVNVSYLIFYLFFLFSGVCIYLYEISGMLSIYNTVDGRLTIIFLFHPMQGIWSRWFHFATLKLSEFKTLSSYEWILSNSFSLYCHNTRLFSPKEQNAKNCHGPLIILCG